MRRLTARAWLWLAGLAGLSTTGYWLLYRPQPLAYVPALNPAPDYAGALEQAEAMVARSRVAQRNPLCSAHYRTHGHPTKRAIVLLHGYTNCPHQYALLGQRYFEDGYNVVVPCFPNHGKSTRSPKASKVMTAEALVATVAEAIDIAHGFGDHVDIFGLSMGGLVAGWAAQHRSDVDRVVMLAPAFAFQAIPDYLRPFYARALTYRRNRFGWWDEVLKEQVPGPGHAYAGYYSWEVGQILRLSTLVQRASARRAPSARSMVVVINPSDATIDRRGPERVAANWQRHGANVETHVLPATWRLIHDAIDPAQPLQQIDRVYASLLAWTAGH